VLARFLIISALLLAFCLQAASAAPPVKHFHFKVLARGYTENDDPALPANRVETLAAVDKPAWERVWVRLHPDKFLGQPRTQPAPLPDVQFQHYMVVVLIGRPGSQEIHLMGLRNQGQTLGGNYENLSCPGVRGDGRVLPYEAVLTWKTTARLALSENETSRQTRALEALAVTARAFPDVPLRGVTDAWLTAQRTARQARGEHLLARIDAISTRQPRAPHAPYLEALAAQVVDLLLGDTTQARARWKKISARYEHSSFGALARARLRAIDGGARDAAARSALDAARQALLVDKSLSTSQLAKRWLEYGGEYEALASQRPESIYLATRCYLEAANVIGAPPKLSQSAVLRCAALQADELDAASALRTYWAFVRRWPEAGRVPFALHSMYVLARENKTPQQAAAPYRQYLAKWPKSPQAPSVRALLSAIKRAAMTAGPVRINT
jgi:hypothetical protein